MIATMPAPVTHTIAVPTALDPAEAIARLRAAEDAARANPHWLVPTSLSVDWTETGGTISGEAFGFDVDGAIAVAGGAATITFTVPWTGKALLDNFGPRLEKAIRSALA
jgi:hypothetical protein